MSQEPKFPPMPVILSPKQEFLAATPASRVPADEPPRSEPERALDMRFLRPTPVAQAVVPACEPPPASTPMEIDARIDRLLSENLALMHERKRIYENLTSAHERGRQLLDAARRGHRLAREYSSACKAAVENPTVANSVLADAAFEALVQWAAKPL